MSTKHTVTLPDGTVAKRTSQNRTYSHVVVGHWPAAKILAVLNTDLQRCVLNAVKYRDIAEGRRDREFGSATSEQYAEWADACEARIIKLQAEIEAGVTDGPWGALTWSSRKDLADKQAASYAKHGYAVRVLPTEIS